MMNSILICLCLLGQGKEDNPKVTRDYSLHRQFYYDQNGHYVARSIRQGRYTRYYDNSGFYIGRSQQYKNGSFYGEFFYDTRNVYRGRTVKTPNSFRTRVERRIP